MKELIHDVWERLGESDYQLDVASGMVNVFDRDTKKWKKYRLPLVYRQLVRRAYENGRKNLLPYTSDSL